MNLCKVLYCWLFIWLFNSHVLINEQEALFSLNVKSSNIINSCLTLLHFLYNRFFPMYSIIAALYIKYRRKWVIGSTFWFYALICKHPHLPSLIKSLLLILATAEAKRLLSLTHRFLNFTDVSHNQLRIMT